MFEPCFPAQKSFVKDTARYKTAVCSRRAGKSVGCAWELLETPIKKNAPSLYFTLTRGSAKRIIWPTLLKINKQFSLGFEPNESELILKRNDQALVFLSGADNKSEIEKWRGVGWGKVIGDEAQSLPSYLEKAVEEVLAPSLMDHDGTLSLIGTPAPVPVGYFYDCCMSSGWSHHYWTVFENPHVPNAQKHLDEVLKRRGLTIEDPSIQREYFGRWVYDPNSLVFRFDDSKNCFKELPKFKSPYEYVFGIDLGFDDADAIAVLAFNKESPNCYVVDEYIERGKTITELTNKIQDLIKEYNPISLVVDTGGLGKKIAEEIKKRSAIPLKAADKARKFEFIELMNDALRSGRLFAKPDSRFVHDCKLIEWDRSNPEKLAVSDRFHSDISDAVLYAYKESLHWLHEPEPVKTEIGSTLWYKEEMQRMEEEAEKKWRQNKQDEEEWKPVLN